MSKKLAPVRVADLKPHPAAALFPMFPKHELQELADDIAKHGQREPIVLFEGKILDGRNRHAACMLAKVKPWSIELDHPGNPYDYVWSMNAERRHLPAGQKAAIFILKEKESGAWEKRQSATAKAGNERRSEATKARPRSADGTMAEGSSHLSRDKRLDTSHTHADVAGEAKVSSATAARAQSVANAAPELLESVAAGEISLARAHRQVVHASKAKALNLAALKGRFAVVYADPPWSYSNSGFDGAPDDHYPTMKTADVCALPIGDRTTEDAVCFLWVTNPLLEDGLRVLKEWGFTYKTNLVWVKDRGTYLGFYAIGHHELLLIGTKGSAVPLRETLPKSVIEAPRGAHSEKPELYAMIERMYPAGSCVELFSRRPEAYGKRWTHWGNEP